MACKPRRLIEKRGHGGLAVGARYAHQSEMARRLAIPGRSQKAQGDRRVGHPNPGDTRLQLVGRELLAHHRRTAGSDSGIDERVAVRKRASHRHEQIARGRKTRVGADAGYLHLGGSHRLLYYDVFSKLVKYHIVKYIFKKPFKKSQRCSESVTRPPLRRAVPPPGDCAAT